MNTFSDFAAWRLIIWSVMFIGIVLFFSCGNDDDDDTLEQPIKEQLPETVIPPSTNQTPAEVAPQLDAVTFTIDATNRETWAYFSFAKGDVLEVVGSGKFNGLGPRISTDEGKTQRRREWCRKRKFGNAQRCGV